MTTSEFMKKFCSLYLWGNLLAMAAVVAALVFAVKIGLNIYTKHGQAVEIPNLTHKSMTEARRIITEAKLNIEVIDTGYVKELPADCVLEQKPIAGSKVKEGHTITITVNASSTPTLTLPDVVQNSSLREATAKLKAMGFKVGNPQYVTGEKDWVYGVTVDGYQVVSGDKISINKTLIIQVGNGSLSETDSIHYIDQNISNGNNSNYDYDSQSSDIDDFEEVP